MQLHIRLNLAEVSGAWTSWLVNWNAVFAGSTSKSDGVLHSLVPVVVDTESAAHSEAFISVLVAAVASGRMSDWR